MSTLGLLLSFGIATASMGGIAQDLQEVSVTIVADTSIGSGVIVTRGEYNYVLTASHVIKPLRRTRNIIDPRTGTERTIVEFNEANVVQNIYEDGRKVGKLEMSAEVLCYSDDIYGEDIALLRVKKKNFIDASAEFYLNSDVPEVGTDLYHVGSLQGQFGSNSLTTGIISQIGRVSLGKLYDQVSCTAFPGSSGGGIFLKDTGAYVGMLVRGSGETFNLIVPIRRIHDWAHRMGVQFVLDPSLPIPTEAEIVRIPIEDTGPHLWNRSRVEKEPIVGPTEPLSK